MPDRNILSICGIEKDEVIISKILEFFLDSKNEHCLGDLFAKSLLQAANIEVWNYDFRAEIEISTQNNKRIDLLLQNDDMCIFVENKIYAELNNDLGEYMAYAKEQNQNAQGIVLSIKELKPSDNKNKDFSERIISENPLKSIVEKGGKSCEVTYITYADFIENLKANFGFYLQDSNKKYIAFVSEFIQSIENLKKGAKMDNDFIKFAIENYGELDKLYERIYEIRKAFDEKLNDLKNHLKNDNLRISNPRQSGRILYRHIEIKLNKNISICAMIGPHHYRLEICSYDSKYKQNLLDLMPKLEEYKPKREEFANGENFYFAICDDQKLALDTPTSEVAKFINEIINKL